MDDSDSREVGVNSSDEDAFFTLQFHSINFCFPRAGIYEDDQGISDKEEAKNTDTVRADKPGIGGVDVEENPDIGRADRK